MCIFNGWVWELKTKVWDLFVNFTIEKRRAVFFWSPLKDTLPVMSYLFDSNRLKNIYND
jgi:hypothetical protein